MIFVEGIVILAVLKALAILVTLSCLPFYKVLGYDLYIDLFVTFSLLFIYHGSAHGMMMATLAGITVSIVLRACRFLFGYDRYSFARRQWEYWSE